MSLKQKRKSNFHVTPDRIYKIIKYVWGYEKKDLFDPCPEVPAFNGLNILWRKINYVNPPYKKDVFNAFINKAFNEIKNHNHTILLLPSKTEQPWFHRIVEGSLYDIIWIKKRLKFKNDKWNSGDSHFLVLLR